MCRSTGASTTNPMTTQARTIISRDDPGGQGARLSPGLGAHDRSGNGPLDSIELSASGTLVHLKGYGLVKVFKLDAPNGDAEYWASSDLGVDELRRMQYAGYANTIEQYHRGIKQFCGVERCQAHGVRAQRSHTVTRHDDRHLARIADPAMGNTARMGAVRSPFGGALPAPAADRAAVAAERGALAQSGP